MKFFTAAAIASMSLGVTALDGPNVAPLEGFVVEALEWEIDVNAQEAPIHLNGTVEQIIDQLGAIDPSYATAIEKRSAQMAKRSLSAESGLEKRDHTICGIWPDAAYKGRIQEGINYLRGVGGRPTLGPGPGVCSRVSCSYNSAIWWCNDNRSTKVLGSFADIANAAQIINNECSWFQVYDTFVRGQRFHNDLVNVIVRGNEC